MARRAASKPSPLIVSVAGVRGTVGGSLTPETVARYVSAYAMTFKGTDVLVAGDSRASRGWIAAVVAGTLIAHGKRPFIADLLATPTIGIAVRGAGLDGAVAITASHNPVEYNGLKFFTKEGIFLGPAEFEKLKANLGAQFPRLDEYAQSWQLDPAKLLELHVEALASVLRPVDGKLRVAIDCCNGAGSVIAPLVARMYGANPHAINDDPTSPFPRGAEPLPGNLKALSAAVREKKCAVGFALDPDADRLALVDETGRPIGEERTLVLCADAWMRLKGRTTLVANLSSTRALDDVAKMHGSKLFRSKVGEAHVVALMKAKRAAIGGEGNGGVIVPEIHPGRDAAAGIALILLGMRNGGWKSLSAWNASIPDYALVKDKVSIDGIDAAAALARIRKTCVGAEFDTNDGLKAVWEDRWLHVRPSGTEPILRLFAEAPTDSAARKLVRAAKGVLA